MALWVKTDGTTEEVHPHAGGVFSLEELQHFVDGYIELVHTRDGQMMFINEEGLLQESAPNFKATELIHPRYNIAGYIRGNAIICGPQEVE